MNKSSFCFREMRIMLLLISIVLTVCGSTHAATYYVKDNNCSDNNNGSESSPWCHCPGMAGWSGGAKLSAGDTAYFDKAGTWIAASGSNVLNIKGGVTYIGDTWGTGTRAKFQATGNLSKGVVSFYDDDPTLPTVFKGFEIDANHTSTTGIDMNGRGWSIPDSPLTGAIKRIQNCVVHDTYSQQSLGQYEYGIMVGCINGAATEVKNVEILDNIVYNQSRTGITIYPDWSGANPDLNKVSEILIRGNEVYDTAQDPGYSSGIGIVLKDHVDTATVEFNYVHGYHGSTGETIIINSDISGGTGPRNITIRYNILTTTSPSALHIRTYGSKDIKFYGNVVLNTAYGVFVDSGLSGSLSLLIYNNTFYNSNVYISNYSATTSALELKNNIIYTTGDTPLTDAGAKLGANHNNNLYYRVGGGTLVSAGGSTYTSANLTSYEATGLSSNPLFVNTSNLPTGFTGTFGVDKRPNTDGLSLQSNSPARDAGVDLGSLYNSSINSISRPYGAGWDRGAYEVGVQDSIPSPPSNLRIVR